VADLITSSYALARLPNITADQEAILPEMITAASAAVEKYCDRPLAKADLDEWYSAGSRGIYLRGIPINSIASLDVGRNDPATLDPDTYTFDALTGYVFGATWANDGWGWGWSPGYGHYLGGWDGPFAGAAWLPIVRVRYNAGYDPVPPDVQEATFTTLKAMYDRQTQVGIVRSETLGPHTIMYSDQGLMAGLPGAATSLLGPYKLYRI
jgi:hypothetical protein